MSSGAFLNAFYETNNGNIVPIRIQPETAALVLDGNTNTVPAGPGDAGFPSAQVSKGRRTIGINARLVRVIFPPGGAPDGYSDRYPIAVPWLQSSTFGAINRSSTGTYLGSACNVAGVSAEEIN